MVHEGRMSDMHHFKPSTIARPSFLGCWFMLAARPVRLRNTCLFPWKSPKMEGEVPLTPMTIAPPSRPTAGASRVRVLCVDDEPQVLEGLGLHLRRRYDVA